MRWLAGLRVLFVSGCALLAAQALPAAAGATAIDRAAEQYVRLVLEIGTHEKGYIDAYFGPESWKTEAEANPRSVADLKLAADGLAEMLAKLAASESDRLLMRRLRSLQANVRAARFRLDMIDGVRVPFRDEAERLFAMRLELKPLSHFDPILRRIETLAPGRGTLAERIEAFRARYAISADRLQRVMDAAIAECRRRTRAHIDLPANERFAMEFVTKKSWDAYNWYRGNSQSLIQVNIDFPIFIDRALGLGCHEGYPGHHVHGIYYEKLYRQNGWAEFSVQVLYAPQGPLNEGGANFGVDLAFPGEERLAFERGTLYPLAGLDPATAPAYDALRRAVAELAGAHVTIAAMYIDGEIDRDRALDLIQRYRLVSRARAEQALSFAQEYRSYVINYAAGENVVRAHVARAGNIKAQWSAYLRIFAEPTLPSDLE